MALEPGVARVLLGELVDVPVGRLALLELDRPRDGHVVVRVVLRVDLDGDPRIALHVVPLGAAGRSVEQDVLAVVVDPDGRHVRRPVAPDGRDGTEVLAEEQLCLRVGEVDHLLVG